MLSNHLQQFYKYYCKGNENKHLYTFAFFLFPLLAYIVNQKKEKWKGKSIDLDSKMTFENVSCILTKIWMIVVNLHFVKQYDLEREIKERFKN